MNPLYINNIFNTRSGDFSKKSTQIVSKSPLHKKNNSLAIDQKLSSQELKIRTQYQKKKENTSKDKDKTKIEKIQEILKNERNAYFSKEKILSDLTKNKYENSFIKSMNIKPNFSKDVKNMSEDKPSKFIIHPKKIKETAKKITCSNDSFIQIKKILDKKKSKHDKRNKSYNQIDFSNDQFTFDPAIYNREETTMILSAPSKGKRNREDRLLAFSKSQNENFDIRKNLNYSYDRSRKPNILNRTHFSYIENLNKEKASNSNSTNSETLLKNKGMESIEFESIEEIHFVFIKCYKKSKNLMFNQENIFGLDNFTELKTVVSINEKDL